MNNINNLFNNKQNNSSRVPLYPEEAYSPQNNQFQQDENPSQKQNGQEQSNILQNPLIPLLLASMQGGNNNFDLMKTLLAGNSVDSQAQMIQALTSSLTKNKKKEAPKNTEPSGEKSFPKNESLY